MDLPSDGNAFTSHLNCLFTHLIGGKVLTHHEYVSESNKVNRGCLQYKPKLFRK